eukprot:3560545-Pyramimonas_sp.AAC.1
MPPGAGRLGFAARSECHRKQPWKAALAQMRKHPRFGTVSRIGCTRPTRLGPKPSGRCQWTTLDRLHTMCTMEIVATMCTLYTNSPNLSIGTAPKGSVRKFLPLDSTGLSLPLTSAINACVEPGASVSSHDDEAIEH